MDQEQLILLMESPEKKVVQRKRWRPKNESIVEKIKQKKKLNTLVTLHKVKKKKKPNPLLSIWKFEDAEPYKKKEGLFTQVYKDFMRKVQEHDKRRAERESTRKIPTEEKQKLDEKKKFDGVAKLLSPQETFLHHQVSEGEESYDLSREEAHELHPKINILSNILIQPSGIKSSQPADETCKKCCDTVSEIYLEFLRHLKQCNPEHLRSNTCQDIVKLLQSVNVL